MAAEEIVINITNQDGVLRAQIRVDVEAIAANVKSAIADGMSQVMVAASLLSTTEDAVDGVADDVRAAVWAVVKGRAV